jgi:nucleoside-diphosphate-sugar epimerase
MRILVTGAAGFVGSEVVRSLLAEGQQVTAVDRVQESPRHLTAATLSGVTAVALDLERREEVAALLEATRPEGLVHLAWYANPADYLVSRANLSSFATSIAVVEAALAAGCRKIVIGGSCVEYAIQDRPLLESDPADPRTLYAACKHAAWEITRVLAQTAGAELAWARIFHIHGPGENRRRLLPWVAGQLRAGCAVPLTDGTQVRDHLHVADVAAGLTTLLRSGAEGIYNVCSGEPVRLRRVLEVLGELVGRTELLQFGELPHRPNDTMFLAGDNTRLRGLGWSPRFGLRDGLADALAGYLS